MDNNRIVYGINPVEELILKKPLSVEHVFFEKDRKNDRLFRIMKQCRTEKIPYNLVPAKKLRALSSTMHHQGIAATCSLIPFLSEEQLLDKLNSKADPVVLLPASIEDPRNLGAIIRSAVAFGADALILERKNSVSITPVVAKTSAGALEHCSIARPKSLEAFLKGLISKGFRIIGTDMKGGVPPDAISLCGPIIILLGGEHRGIPPYLFKLCTNIISIPMSNETASLNVAATAAILLYEISRQRKSTG